MNIPLPLFILRKIVRANPWLLSDAGEVCKPVSVTIWPFIFEVTTTTGLLPHRKARLRAEAEAGTLFQ